jgi:hypothetical protein
MQQLVHDLPSPLFAARRGLLDIERHPGRRPSAVQTTPICVPVYSVLYVRVTHFFTCKWTWLMSGYIVSQQRGQRRTPTTDRINCFSGPKCGMLFGGKLASSS